MSAPLPSGVSALICLSLGRAIWYAKPIVRRYYLIIGLMVCGLLAGSARAETFKLVSGDSVTGEVLTATANDLGVQIKVAEGDYQRIPWANFSQEDLKQFVKNPKLEAYVEPFIEIPRAEKLKKTEVNIKPPPRLELPARQSLFGAMFSSGLGLFVLLLLYCAIIYAGYEVAIFRAQPPLMVCGLSAIPVLGFLAPIVFLAMPMRLQSAAETEETAPEATGSPTISPGAVAEGAPNPMQATGAEHPAGLKMAHTDSAMGKAKLPETVTYKRGQFTFNRRFFETKFPGFFGVVRRDADRDMVLTFKSARGEYICQRISRIAANDLHLLVHRGQASEEIMIPFQEIQEICLKHKDA
jgi:hypothetical protein